MVPTAEYFFDSPTLGISTDTEYTYCKQKVIEAAREFAKLHVQAALEKSKEDIYTDLINWIDNEILLNPYYKDSTRLKEGVTIVKNRLIIKNEVHKRTND